MKQQLKKLYKLSLFKMEKNDQPQIYSLRISKISTRGILSE